MEKSHVSNSKWGKKARLFRSGRNGNSLTSKRGFANTAHDSSDYIASLHVARSTSVYVTPASFSYFGPERVIIFTHQNNYYYQQRVFTIWYNELEEKSQKAHPFKNNPEYKLISFQVIITLFYLISYIKQTLKYHPILLALSPMTKHRCLTAHQLHLPQNCASTDAQKNGKNKSF